jgi:hypothetical protein
VKPAAAGDGAVDKHGTHGVAGARPFLLPVGEQPPSLIQRLRLIGHPRHPRAEVLSALDDGSVQMLRVGHAPASQQDAFGLDSGGGLMHVLRRV